MNKSDFVINNITPNNNKMTNDMALLDDGATISITNNKNLFLPDSLRKLNNTDNRLYTVSGIAGKSIIDSFGIMEITTMSQKQKPIKIKMFGAYTPNINTSTTTIICRHDLINYGKLRGFKEDKLGLRYYYNIDDYIPCLIQGKIKYLKLENGMNITDIYTTTNPNITNNINEITDDELIIDAIDYNSYSLHNYQVQHYNVSNAEINVQNPAHNNNSDQHLDHQAILLHNILGHQSEKTIKNSIETKSITGLPSIPKFLKNYRCTSCAKANPNKKRTHPARPNNPTSRPLQRIHIDMITVPPDYILNTKNFDGSEVINAKHFLLAVDEFTRRSYFIPTKSVAAPEIKAAFDKLLHEIGQDKSERLLRIGGNLEQDCKIDFIHCDRGATFIGTLQDYIKTEHVTSKNYNQAIILTAPAQGELQFLNGIAEARWHAIKRTGFASMYQSGYYIWPYAMSYANNIQNMVSHTEHDENQPSPYYRMFGHSTSYQHFFPFASPAVSQITDEDRRHGLKANKVGVAMDFESIRKPHTKVILCFNHEQGKKHINECQIKRIISQHVQIDNWHSVITALKEKRHEAKFLDNSFHEMKQAFLADEEMQEIIASHGITPNDTTSNDDMTTMNIESQYRELDGDTKKAKLIAQIKEINSRLQGKMEITPRDLRHGYKHFEKLLQKCKEREKSEKENSQQTELNINTLTMNSIPITDGQDFYTPFHLDYKDYHHRNAFLENENLNSSEDMSNNEILLSNARTDYLATTFKTTNDSNQFEIHAVCQGQTATDTFRPKPTEKDLTPQQKADAVAIEFENLLSTGTLVRLKPEDHIGIDKPTSKNTVRAFAKFTVKDDFSCKARIVAMGNRQPHETYSAISYGQMSKISLRVILLTGLLRGLQPKQADIKSAFLTEDYPGTFYIKYEQETYKMEKYLYGLKQSGYMFYKKISKLLQNLNFKQLIAEDPCVFTRVEHDGFLSIIGILTDDLLFSMHDDKINEVVKYLEQQGLQIPHVKPVYKFNGLEINYDPDVTQMTINQTVLIKQTISELESNLGYEITSQKDIPNANFKLEENMVDVNKTQYQSLVGSLTWIAHMSRPDIIHVVASAATVNKCPKQNHLQILLQLFGYLKETAGKVMTYRRPQDRLPEITIFTDSDWMTKGVDYDILSNKTVTNAKSQSGIIIMFNETAIYWNSKKQDCPALSASAAEIIAATTAYDNALPILKLLDTFGYRLTRTLHFIDNESAIKAITNDKLNNVSRLLIRHYAYVKHLVTKLISFPIYVESKKNISDYLTKSRELLRKQGTNTNQAIDIVFGLHFNSKEKYMAHIRSLCTNENFAKVNWAEEYNIKNFGELLNRRKEDLNNYDLELY